MKCPKGKEMVFAIRKEKFTYKGEEIIIDFEFYLSEDGDQYTDEILDERNVNKVKEKYNENHL